MIWACMLAYINRNRRPGTSIDERTSGQIKGRLPLSDAEKATLAEIAYRLGRKALEELAAVAGQTLQCAARRREEEPSKDG
jgi:hypothetical protein